MNIRSLVSLATAAALISAPTLAMARSSEGLPPPPTSRGYAVPPAPTWTEPTAPTSDMSVPEDTSGMGDSLPTDMMPPIPTPDAKGGGMHPDIYPYPGGSGISVDVSVTKTVTPDFVAINAYCEVGPQTSRDDAKKSLAKIYDAVKAAVGANGTVRRSGGSNVYPYYDPQAGQQTSKFSASINLLVRITNLALNQTVSDAVENAGCTVNWDVRLLDTQAHESSIINDLLSRLATRKALFEKLLKRKLNKVAGASMSTYVDSYGTYDPETNTVDATTTLTVSYDVGGGVSSTPPYPRLAD